ncbi:MAG: hypothetical protein JKX80_01715 [Candidatus Pacebacteria bacterium]|nr:hypothetical protein [Candidatus Paceibacterota bacterium]
MEPNKNQNPKKIPKENNREKSEVVTTGNLGASAQEVTDTPHKNTTQIPEGALNKALMRTFRGDVSKGLGPQASQQQVDHFIPKSKPQAQIDADGNQIETTKKKNEAIVHTFKDDVQNLVRNKKMSMARIAALESDRGERLPHTQEKREPWKTTMVVALTVLFLVIGVVIALGSFYAYRLNTASNLAPQFDPAIIFTEARESIDVTEKNPRGILSLLGNARRNTFFSLGSVVELHLTQSIDVSEEQAVIIHLDSIDFLEKIEASVPETFLRTLGTEYVLGIHVIDENVPFLILTTQSYGHAFAGMLSWEKSIEENFIPFFSPGTGFIKPAVAEGENAFSDTVIENLDVRVLRDDDGTIRILYTFLNRNTIVITTDIRTLIELSNRLRVSSI